MRKLAMEMQRVTGSDIDTLQSLGSIPTKPRHILEYASKLVNIIENELNILGLNFKEVKQCIASTKMRTDRELGSETKMRSFEVCSTHSNKDIPNIGVCPKLDVHLYNYTSKVSKQAQSNRPSNHPPSRDMAQSQGLRSSTTPEGAYEVQSMTSNPFNIRRRSEPNPRSPDSPSGELNHSSSWVTDTTNEKSIVKDKSSGSDEISIEPLKVPDRMSIQMNGNKENSKNSQSTPLGSMVPLSVNIVSQYVKAKSPRDSAAEETRNQSLESPSRALNLADTKQIDGGIKGSNASRKSKPTILVESSLDQSKSLGEAISPNQDFSSEHQPIEKQNKPSKEYHLAPAIDSDYQSRGGISFSFDKWLKGSRHVYGSEVFEEEPKRHSISTTREYLKSPLLSMGTKGMRLPNRVVFQIDQRHGNSKSNMEEQSLLETSGDLGSEARDGVSKGDRENCHIEREKDLRGIFD
ncbi:uncharacterized protein BJ171DRAFT_515523, partial [Polychytrium aggregatum]|uniref:uncharacterized protein n=1 Tax=Polychytrium aggregatum TaxID=110093 RepID=UPI0022FE2845